MGVPVQNDARESISGVDVVVSDYVVFTQIGASLNFDQYHGNFPGVFHSVCRSQWDIDGLVFGYQTFLIIDGDLGRAFNHDPMLGTMMVRLQAERRARCTWMRLT